MQEKIILFILGTLFLFRLPAIGQKPYEMRYIFSHEDSISTAETSWLKTAFTDSTEAHTYVQQIPQRFLSRGFPLASVDSATYDFTSATVYLYAGKKYMWKELRADSLEADMLRQTGIMRQGRNLPVQQITRINDKILDYYESNGYPFAQVWMEDVTINGADLYGALRVQKGPLYAVDSIRIHGPAKIKNSFLQNHLDIRNGSLFDRRKLDQISERIRNLPYLQELNPWTITMLGNGSVLNLYLAPKRSSRVNVLIGFLPGNEVTGKSGITADVDLNLKNILASGETILVNWQQLQPQSPRLRLGFTQPYLFRSRFGTDLAFHLLKKDSAWMELDAMAGITFQRSANSEWKIFYQSINSFLLAGGLDTTLVLRTKSLPPNIDVRSGNLGIAFQFRNTDYRLNPRRGTDVQISGSAGMKTTVPIADIINLKDPENPDFDFATLYSGIQNKTYRILFTGQVSRYFPLGGNHVAKASTHLGVLESPSIFRNELFRIGGYALLRGFEEESIYANRYATLTAEYRYLLGLNSYFFAFTDGAFTSAQQIDFKQSNTFISGGAGIEFETKVGLLNLSVAVGKRNDLKFDLRNSTKIHFGYINYF